MVLVSFDIDDTLYNFKETFQQAMSIAFEELVHTSGQDLSFSTWFAVFQEYNQQLWPRFEANEIDIHTFRNLRFSETMKKLGLGERAGEGQYFHDVYLHAFYEEMTPFTSVEKLLTQLQTQNIELAIISNGPSDTQYEKLRCLGLKDYFADEQIFVSEEVGSAKPDQAIFHKCAHSIPKEVDTYKYHVGDSWSHDVIGAIEAGWTAVYFNWKNELPKETALVSERIMEVKSLERLNEWFAQKG